LVMGSALDVLNKGVQRHGSFVLAIFCRSPPTRGSSDWLSSSFILDTTEGAEMDLLASEDADALGWEGMEAYQDGDV